jgi:hypothetical protein
LGDGTAPESRQGARHQTRGVSLRFWISQERQGSGFMV